MQNRAPRIAIVRLSALGDIINSAIVLQFIKKHYPDSKIEWITEDVFAPILLKHPLLDSIHTLSLKKIKKQKDFSLLKENIKRLKNLGDFDYIIDMQGLIKSAVVSRLIGKNTYGFDSESTRESLASYLYKHTCNIAYEENIIRRNCKVVADALDIEISDRDILDKEALFEIQSRPETLLDGKNIAIIVGASWLSKIYPKEQVVKLCELLDAQCHIIWGSEKEYEDAKWIASHAKNALVTEKMDLKSLLNFIAHCDLSIGNDPGPPHMAWAMNRAAITLFGPTNSRMIYETPINIAIESSSSVDVKKIDKNDLSIADISPQLIANRAKGLL
jgi:heptosyltransferase-1